MTINSDVYSPDVYTFKLPYMYVYLLYNAVVITGYKNGKEDGIERLHTIATQQKDTIMKLKEENADAQKLKVIVHVYMYIDTITYMSAYT